MFGRTRRYRSRRRNSNDSWQNIDQQLGFSVPGADTTL
jgi:hypothetical protein